MTRTKVGLLWLVVLVGCGPTPVPATEVNIMPGSETAAGFSEASASGPATMLAQDNFDWAWSEDGTTWHSCDITTCGYGGSMPMAPEQGAFISDPSIAGGAPGTGIVISTLIADRAQPYGQTNGLVIALMSIDGGRNWIQTVAVNPYKSGDGCDEGAQDQPDMSYDASTDTFWVAWRHNGSGTYGLCTRGFHVNPGTYEIVFEGPSYEVENVDRTPFYGVGGVYVRHHDETLTVVYSNTDHDEFSGCPGGLEIRWFANQSTDGGHSWSSSHQIYDTTNFSWCWGAGLLEQDFRNFAFDVDPSGGYWVAVSDTANSIRVFNSADGVTWNAETTISSPGRQTMGHLALAADRSGQIALSFYRTTTNLSPQVMRWLAARGSAPMDTWSVALPVSGTIPLVPTSDGRLLGDYQGMGIVDPALFPSSGGTFFPVWTATDAAANVSMHGNFVSYTP